MNVYCDNYAVCNGVILDWSKDVPSDDHIRVRGWRRWRGQSLTGKDLDVTLCTGCARSQPLQRDRLLEGQEGLFDTPVQSGQDVPQVRNENSAKARRT